MASTTHRPEWTGSSQGKHKSDDVATNDVHRSRQRSLSAPAVVPRVETDPKLSQGYATKKAPSPDAAPPGIGSDSGGTDGGSPTNDRSPKHTLFASAYQMEPLALNFDKGPFDKRHNGHILKTDTAAQAALINRPDTTTEDDISVLGSLIDQYRRIRRSAPTAKLSIAGAHRSAFTRSTPGGRWRYFQPAPTPGSALRTTS